MARSPARSRWLRPLGQLAGLLALGWLVLQGYFALRIALMAVLAPASTAFERSEAWRLLTETGRIPWSQQWVDDDQIAAHLKRAVIASEDAGFADHGGIEWEALRSVWQRNQRAEALAERRNEIAERRAAQQARRAGSAASAPTVRKVEARLVGGSTITQQLAKNLFLSGERTALRKAQELVLTLLLEALLDKRRILEIYLNHVELGEGLFGAQAAARHYFRSDAARLGPSQAARLAVMLPAPKRFERTPRSPYLASRSATIAARMGAVQLP